MSLTKQVFIGVKWTALTRLLAQLLNWTITLVVIRLLKPEDYGLLAIATGLLALLTIINEMGLEAALVQRKILNEELPEKIFGLVLVTNFSLFVLLYLGAPSFAAFYGEPQLVDLIRVLAINHLLYPFMVVPRAMLARRMEFRTQGIVDLIGSACASLATLTLALSGQGVWSLAWGALLETAINMAGILWVAKYWCMPSFDLRGMRDAMSFGIIETLDRATWSIQMQIDSLVLGKVLGKEATGVYFIAKDFAWLPMRKISNILNPVAFAGFSRANESDQDVGRLLLVASTILAFVAFPVFFGISSTADEVVDLVLGENWNSAAFPLAILSPIVALQMLGSAIIPALSGSGHPIVNLRQRMVSLIILLFGIFFGIPWGIDGVAVGAAIAYALGFVVQVVLACPVLGLTIREYLGAVSSPLAAASLMYMIVNISRFALSDSIGSTIQLLLTLVAIGAISFFAAAWLIDREKLVAVVHTLQRGFAR